MYGKIIKGIAGFYYVHIPSSEEDFGDGFIYECKAKGIFRKDNLRPLVGDDVLMEVIDEETKTGNIVKICDRKNALIRPAVANVDQAMIIFSIVKPQPNFNLLDRFLIMMQQQKVPVVIVFNKLDIDENANGSKYEEIYSGCGYTTVCVSTKTLEGIDKLRTILRGKTTTVAGPSGVGKSSLINSLCGNTYMETGDISRKIERGKHTTRHSELITLPKDTYVLDTPGFSSLSVFNMEPEDLYTFYPEFIQYEKNCRFAGCSHINEPDCAVKEACRCGNISELRYENYCLIYNELKSLRKW